MRSLGTARRGPRVLTGPSGDALDALIHAGVLHQCEIDCKIYSERSDGFIADSPIAGTYTLAEFGRLTNLMEPRSKIGPGD